MCDVRWGDGDYINMGGTVYWIIIYLYTDHQKPRVLFIHIYFSFLSPEWLMS